jgi:hypothetical protein
MARNTLDFEFDDDDEYEADEPRGRNEVADLRKAYNALKRQNKELLEQFNTAQKSLRERSVKDVLASKGMNEKISAFIPADVTSPEDVAAWVDQYADVFGGAAPAPADEAATEPDPNLVALSKIASAQQSGQTFSKDSDQIASLINGAQSIEELNMLLYGDKRGPQAT